MADNERIENDNNTIAGSCRCKEELKKQTEQIEEESLARMMVDRYEKMANK